MTGPLPFFGRHHIPTPAPSAETATAETAAMTPADRLDALTGTLERLIDLSAGVVYHHHPEDDPGNAFYGTAEAGWLPLDPDDDDTFDTVHTIATAAGAAVDALPTVKALAEQLRTATAAGG